VKFLTREQGRRRENLRLLRQRDADHDARMCAVTGWTQEELEGYRSKLNYIDRPLLAAIKRENH